MQANHFSVGLALLVLSLTSASMGQQSQEVDAESWFPAPRREIGKDPHYSVALIAQQFDYVEPGVMKDSGLLTGAGFSYSNVDQNYFRLEGDIVGGSVAYDGALSNGTPYKASSKDRLFNFRFLAGIPSARVEGVHIYTGLGARYLEDDTTNDQYGYRREITYLYLPGGIRWRQPLAERWVISGNAEVNVLLGGTAGNDAKGDFPAMVFRQSNGFGFRLAMGFSRAVPGGEIEIQPFYQLWTVADSAVVEKVIRGTRFQFIEPRNQATHAGLSLQFNFN